MVLTLTKKSVKVVPIGNVFFCNQITMQLIKFIFRYAKEEPFSVISVDIRNHSTLLDSLEQYVKGELLEGADAYHCDICNKKVWIILSLEVYHLQLERQLS